MRFRGDRRENPPLDREVEPDLPRPFSQHSQAGVRAQGLPELAQRRSWFLIASLVALVK